MPAYQFIAIDQQGKQHKGVLQADSAKHVRQQLRGKDLLPSSVEIVEQTNAQSQGNPLRSLFKKSISATDLALMTRQLSVLLAASIPLEEALQAVARQSEKKSIKTLLIAVRSKVLEGFTLARALDDAGRFGSLYIATIAAGEKSGHLDLIMSQLADYTENRANMQKKIQAAMVYPVLLAVMAFSIMMGLMVYVVPKVAAAFTQNDQALPLLTEVVLSTSNFIAQFWVLIIIAVLAASVFANRFVATKAGKAAFHATQLRLPVIGKLVRGINASRVASTLAILVRSGVPLVEALKIASEVATNVHIKDVVGTAAQKVTEGSRLAQQLEHKNYFPPMMVQMVKSGENSGELDNMLQRAADMQDRQVESTIATALALLEPLMLVLMGVVVLVIVMAVMLPIINMNTLI